MGEVNQNQNIQINADYERMKAKEDDFNKLTQNSDTVIVEIAYFLESVKLVDDPETGNKIVVKLGNPLMNELGRKWIIARLKAYLCSNTYLSEIEKKDADSTYRIDGVNFVFDMYKSLDEFECSDANASKIIHKVCPLIYLALRKGQTDKKAIYHSGNPNTGQLPQTRPPSFGEYLSGGRI